MTMTWLLSGVLLLLFAQIFSHSCLRKVLKKRGPASSTRSTARRPQSVPPTTRTAKLTAYSIAERVMREP
jgi:hypothetical protein